MDKKRIRVDHNKGIVTADPDVTVQEMEDFLNKELGEERADYVVWRDAGATTTEIDSMEYERRKASSIIQAR